MQIDPKKQTQKENYKLIIGSVLPRPIAFVTSINQEGLINAAPFSFFTAVATNPPMISITCSRKRDGEMKDTAKNIKDQKEFVVHVVDGSNVGKINDTATEFPPEISEIEAVGFDLLDSAIVKVPRISQAKVQMECQLHKIIELGHKNEVNTDLIIGEVVYFHIQDDLYHEGKINTEKLNPVGRLAGLEYCKIGDTFSMPRLSYEDWVRKSTLED